MTVKSRWSANIALSFALAASACARQLTYECPQPPSPPAVMHWASAPDSTLLAAGVGVLIVRIVPTDTGVWYADAGNEGVNARVQGTDSRTDRIEELTPLTKRGKLAADGLPPGDYDLTIRHIGFVPRTDRITVRPGYADTLFAALNSKRICLDQRVADSRRSP